MHWPGVTACVPGAGALSHKAPRRQQDIGFSNTCPFNNRRRRAFFSRAAFPAARIFAAP
jgi:hypothetical protein